MVLGTAAVERPALVGELVSALGAEAVVVALDGRGGRGRHPGLDGPLRAAHGRSGARAGGPGRAALHLHGHHPGQHLTEPNFEELAALAGAVPAAVIASGGVTTAAQVARLAAIPLEGAIIGSALYAGRITLPGGPRRRHRACRLSLEPVMLTKRIIPCLDVARGRVVRGVKFSADRDAGDPVQLAARYNAEGADELVFYDITASHEGRGIMLEVLERCARELFIPLCVGGGLGTVEDMYQVLRAGADKTSINSQAVRHPDLIDQGARASGVSASSSP